MPDGRKSVTASISTTYSFKNDIKLVLQDINDSNVSDELIIQRINSMIQAIPENFTLIKTFKTETDEYNLLHLSAKTCRISVFYFLIRNFSLEKYLFSKSRLTPLHLLVMYNIEMIDGIEVEDTQLVQFYKLLIENKHLNINAQDEKGMSALHYAAIKNNYRAVQLLLNTPGIITNIEDKKSMTPLHLACKNSNSDLAILLVQYADVDNLMNQAAPDTFLLHMICKNKIEMTCIIQAILNKLKTACSTEEPSKLLQKAFTKEDSSRQTMLHIAIQNNHLNIVETLMRDYLIDKDICESKNGNLAIHEVAKTGSIAMFDLLEKYDFICSKQNNNLENALHIAASANRDLFIQKYLINENNTEACRVDCQCDCDKSIEIPSVQMLNKDFLTPLLLAAINGNLKCLIELVSDPKTKIEARDTNGNSIYHLFAEYGNLECLQYFLKNHFNKNQKLLMTINNQEETVLQVACRSGNLELIKIVYDLIDGINMALEPFLFNKNMNGQTCFHIACTNGYYNIIEYFLKYRKKTVFLEQADFNSNTSLHLATYGGHSSIVGLLLTYNADCNARNEDNATALDLSCRLGFFDISKMLISCYLVFDNEHSNHDYPLHVACNEGAHEVVKLLLEKGALIDKLNNENQNCLDIAIAKKHREVIKVLLNDPNWRLLIRGSNNIENFASFSQDQITGGQDASITTSTTTVHTEYRCKGENPQLTGLFENRMWDMFEIILDKCILTSTSNSLEADFSILDRPVRKMSRHSLMLIARSGQENLVKHRATLLLLRLKWRFIPRLAFYFNLIIYIIFLGLITIYSLAIAENHNNKVERLFNSTMNNTEQSGSGVYYLKNENPTLYVCLVTFVLINVFKEFFQFLLLSKIAYLMSLKNWLEIFTYVSTMIALHSNSVEQQHKYGSLAILAAFFVFPLKMQKLRVFGLYVVAFMRTLVNSAKFFPIFLIMLSGFVLAFKIRSNFGVELFKGPTEFQFIRTLTMVTGETESSSMGLGEGFLVNYLIYFLFVSLMSIIILNLLVGIAVSDIKQVLDEADIRQISMRIIFVLRIQKALSPMRRCFPFMADLLCMEYMKYQKNNEMNFVKILKMVLKRLKKIFSSKEQAIILADPQKRLEEMIQLLAKDNNDENKLFYDKFKTQLNSLNVKLHNSNRRLEDNLVESSRCVENNFEALRQEINLERKEFELRFKEIDSRLKQSIETFLVEASYYNNKGRSHVDSKISIVENRQNTNDQKVDRVLGEVSKRMNLIFENIEKNLKENEGLEETKKDLRRIRRMSESHEDHLKSLRADLMKVMESLAGLGQNTVRK